MKNRRDFLKYAAAAGVAWPVAACNGSQPNQQAPASGPKPAAGGILDVDILGAFAFVFRDSFSKVEIAAIKQPEGGGEACTFIPHPMGLKVHAGTTIETNLPKLDAEYFACPSGTLTFQGISPAETGLTGFKKDTEESTVSIPGENEHEKWHDLVWMPNLGQAPKDTWRQRTTSRLKLEAGKLTFNRPSGTMATACWDFGPNLTRRPLPMTEAAVYQVPIASGTVQLLADGQVVATLKGPNVKITIGAPTHGNKKEYQKGERVEFYAMFSEIIDPSRKCAARPVPALGGCTHDRQSDRSDGEWCPNGRAIEVP